MALFKILRGNSSKLFGFNGSISKDVPFNDGYCYFTPDNKKFYIDWTDESNGQHRDPLNSFLADKLLSVYTDSEGNIVQTSAKLVGGSSAIIDSNEEIPTSAVLYAKFSDVKRITDGLENDKMDKVNPTGTGYFSLNRDPNHTPGDYSVAVGYQTTASGEGSHAEGANTQATGDYSHSEGIETQAISVGAHAEGIGTQATGDCSHAEGAETEATDTASHAEGNETQATGMASHAEGWWTRAIGKASHAEGVGTIASYPYQHVEGRYNINDNIRSRASNPFPTYAHIVGNGTSGDDRSNALTLTWDGDLWHAGKLSHGNDVAASGLGSYSGGSDTYASGDYSHAEGISTTAQGGASHSEGEDTTATGTSSHAEGYGSVANGSYSHAQNQGTIAYGDSSTVIGKFNISDTTSTKAFIIGNGTADDKRSNMFFIDWDGNACYQNTLLIGDDAIAPDKITDVKFYVEGNSYFNGGITITGNLTASTTPSNDNHLVNKKYVDDNLMRLTHHYIKATAGQAIFDFGTIGINDITNYYLVYFNGLLLIEGIHYTIENNKIVNLLDWTATADDYLQLVGFKPNNPTT